MLHELDEYGPNGIKFSHACHTLHRDAMHSYSKSEAAFGVTNFTCTTWLYCDTEHQCLFLNQAEEMCAKDFLTP